MASRSIYQRTRDLSRNLVDWVFPPACIGCGLEGVFICSDCFATINFSPTSVCNFCGAYTSKRGFCPVCAKRKPAYAGFRAFASYDGVIRKAILQLKYHNAVGLGRYLAGLLEVTYHRAGWDAEVVVPVPIGEMKREQRGYNQAERLAQPLAEALQLNYYPEALKRFHEISSQVGLNELERHANVRKAFVATAKYVKGQKVLLVDDVFTSGATMQAAARELIEAGAGLVWCLAVAKVDHNGNSTIPKPE